MNLNIKETDHLNLTGQREEWREDPIIKNYIYFQESNPVTMDSQALTNFQRFYEIYERDQLVGDIKIFYETEEDIMQKRGQLLMVIGNKSNGIGTRALHMLLDMVKNTYDSIYCHILRSNIASLKMLKRNGFQIEKIEGDDLLLSKSLN
jgi:RimJ/RimL family protein N-acetyltransferase